MNTYVFDDCLVGLKESFDTKITCDMMQDFCNISGDINPLHQDRDFAIRKGFLDRVVYGHLTVAFFSRLAGVYLPGERCLIQEVSYRFQKPVYVNDELTVSGEVIDRDDRTRQIFLKVRICRKIDNTSVVRGKMTLGVLED